MRKELKREVIKNQVVITYDDGSTKKLNLPPAPENIKVDAEASEELNSGHVFKQ